MPTTRAAAARQENGHEERTKDGSAAHAGDKHKTTASQPSHKKRKVKDSTEVSDHTKHEKDTKKEEKAEAAKEERAADDSAQKRQDSEEKKSSTDAEELKNAKGAGEQKTSAIEKQSGRTASVIVEKGIIYFFIRGRVNTPDPHSISEVQRGYLVLRPLPDEEQLAEGVIPDANAARLIALPKKKLPQSNRERFMAFIEKSKASMSLLKDTFFAGEEKETKTRGTQEIPPVTPVGEGIYAVTVTGSTSHLAYMLNIPNALGEVQKSLGLREKGSFVLSLKNPQGAGPSYAQLPDKPDFPKEIMEEFRERKWMPVSRAQHLDYPNSQLLLIGEGRDSFAGAVPSSGDEHTVEDEIVKLDEDEEARIEHLHGDDTIFDDLHVSKKELPALKSTW